jgi:hypothetical protein
MINDHSIVDGHERFRLCHRPERIIVMSLEQKLTVTKKFEIQIDDL